MQTIYIMRLIPGSSRNAPTDSHTLEIKGRYHAVGMIEVARNTKTNKLDIRFKAVKKSSPGVNNAYANDFFTKLDAFFFTELKKSTNFENTQMPVIGADTMTFSLNEKENAYLKATLAMLKTNAIHKSSQNSAPLHLEFYSKQVRAAIEMAYSPATNDYDPHFVRLARETNPDLVGCKVLNDLTDKTLPQWYEKQTFTLANLAEKGDRKLDQAIAIGAKAANTGKKIIKILFAKKPTSAATDTDTSLAAIPQTETTLKNELLNHTRAYREAKGGDGWFAGLWRTIKSWFGGLSKKKFDAVQRFENVVEKATTEAEIIPCVKVLHAFNRALEAPKGKTVLDDYNAEQVDANIGDTIDHHLGQTLFNLREALGLRKISP